MTLRAVEPADHAGLVRMFRACFPGAARRPPAEIERKLGQLFIDGPLATPPRQSLVAADERGQLVGFSGLLVRRWRLGDELLMGRTGTHNMVHPDARRMGVNAKLAVRWREQRTALREGWVGFSDRATDDSRLFHDNWNNPSGQHTRLEQLGFRWEVSRGGRLRRAVDALRGANGPPAAEAELHAGSFEAAPLAEAFEALGGSFPLRLDEPAETWQWLVAYLEDYASRGRFHGAVLHTEAGEPVGFYCGYLDQRGFDVVGFAAQPRWLADAISRLLRDAGDLGARAVTGWATAAELRTLLAAGAVISAGGRGGVATLRADVRHHFQAMEALVSGLEGERWI